MSKLPPLPASHPMAIPTLRLAANHRDAAIRHGRAYHSARLEIRHDPQTERWTVVLLSATTKEDVVIAWKQTEEDAQAWARNYGARR